MHSSRLIHTYLDEFDLEDECAHLGDAAGAPLEALQVVLRQDEEALLPPREDLVPLLPQQTLPHRRRRHRGHHGGRSLKPNVNHVGPQASVIFCRMGLVDDVDDVINQWRFRETQSYACFS